MDPARERTWATSQVWYRAGPAAWALWWLLGLYAAWALIVILGLIAHGLALYCALLFHVDPQRLAALVSLVPR